MSSTTKKAKISQENKELIESFVTTNDLYKSLDDYMRDSKGRTKKAKERIAKDISEMGDKFINEIEEKEKQLEIQKQNEISEIFRKSGDRFGSKPQLNSMPYEEVHRIYVKATEARKGWFTKLMDFLMGW